jgi:hypothetical protein
MGFQVGVSTDAQAEEIMKLLQPLTNSALNPRSRTRQEPNFSRIDKKVAAAIVERHKVGSNRDRFLPAYHTLEHNYTSKEICSLFSTISTYLRPLACGRFCFFFLFIICYLFPQTYSTPMLL